MSLSRQSIALVLTTKNKETKHYIHAKHKTETERPALAKKTSYILVWYAFYDRRLGNRAGPILTAHGISYLEQLATELQWFLSCAANKCNAKLVYNFVLQLTSKLTSTIYH